jgi:hypothetical protein
MNNLGRVKMAGFSATSAGVEGFRIIKNHPATIAVWAGVNILVTVGAFALVFLVAGSSFLAQMRSLEASAANGAPDIQAILPMLGAIAGALLVVVPIVIVVGSMLNAAVNRVVLRPTEKSPGFLRLGMDEVRVFLAQLILGVLFLMVLAVIGVGVSVLGRFNGWLGFFGGLAAAALVIFLAVRLSLAIPLTFASRHLDLFGSFALTKGRFWPILGAYALAFICYLGLAIVFVIVVSVVGGVIGVATVATVGTDPANMGSMMGMLGAAQVVNLLLQSVLAAVVLAIFGGPPAAIYKALSGHGDAEVF